MVRRISIIHVMKQSDNESKIRALRFALEGILAALEGPVTEPGLMMARLRTASAVVTLEQLAGAAFVEDALYRRVLQLVLERGRDEVGPAAEVASSMYARARRDAETMGEDPSHVAVKYRTLELCALQRDAAAAWRHAAMLRTRHTALYAVEVRRWARARGDTASWIGYTVGSRWSYDQAMAGTEPVYKHGADAGYPGGVVWAELEPARAFAAAGRLPDREDPVELGVYALDLPAPLEECSWPAPSLGTEAHRLLIEARIMGRVWPADGPVAVAT